MCLLMLVAAASAKLARLDKVQEPIAGQYIVVLKVKMLKIKIK